MKKGEMEEEGRKDSKGVNGRKGWDGFKQEEEDVSSGQLNSFWLAIGLSSLHVL